MYIWTLRLPEEENIETEYLSAFKSCLSKEELLRAERFHFEKDANRYIVAHALCRIMLSEFGSHRAIDWQFEKEDFGRPYIRPSQNKLKLDFNLSHTVGMVGCVLAKGRRVSLDLEPLSRETDFLALAEKKFSIQESQDVRKSPNHIQRKKFFEYWTLKEAYIKITGKGLREPLDTFIFDLSGETPTCLIEDSELQEYVFGRFEISDHQGAWAIEVSDTDVGRPLPECRELSLKELVACL